MLAFVAGGADTSRQAAMQLKYQVMVRGDYLLHGPDLPGVQVGGRRLQLSLPCLLRNSLTQGAQT